MGLSKIPPLGDVRVESVSPNPVGDRGSGLGGARAGEVITSALPKLHPLGRRAVIIRNNLNDYDVLNVSFKETALNYISRPISSFYFINLYL